MTTEFGLIEQYFARPAPSATLGVGDDAALLAVSAGMQLAISTDMLVAGTHFFPDADPRKLGWKTLAVNISDLAAMGALPRWATLALALPKAEDAWLAAFADGFFKCAGHYGVELIGGDTTRGPLCLSVTIMGEVPAEKALRRDAAQPGDEVWVSGPLGGAALGLAALQGRVPLDETNLAHCLRALETPQPRVALGLALRGIAHAAIDLSDGLLADLGHILERSCCGAEIRLDAIPADAAVAPYLTQDWAQDCLLAGGDDYELCFTAPAFCHDAILAIGAQLHLELAMIGSISEGDQLDLRDAQGRRVDHAKRGYDHFA